MYSIYVIIDELRDNIKPRFGSQQILEYEAEKKHLSEGARRQKVIGGNRFTK
jgi:hypothetical protein